MKQSFNHTVLLNPHWLFHKKLPNNLSLRAAYLVENSEWVNWRVGFFFFYQFDQHYKEQIRENHKNIPEYSAPF